jgi:putative transposase
MVFALRQADTGVTVAEVCRKMGISEATYYNWKKSTAARAYLNCSGLSSWKKKTSHSNSSWLT